MFQTQLDPGRRKREKKEKNSFFEKLKINPGHESKKDCLFIDISVPFLMKFITPLKCASQMHFI